MQTKLNSIRSTLYSLSNIKRLKTSEVEEHPPARCWSAKLSEQSMATARQLHTGSRQESVKLMKLKLQSPSFAQVPAETQREEPSSVFAWSHIFFKLAKLGHITTIV